MPAQACWQAVVRRIDAHLAQTGDQPQRLQVLLPFAQLIEPARQAWSAAHPSGFSPRFETSRQWAARLAPWTPAPGDLTGDLARDTLVAESLLDRVLHSRPEPALRSVLVQRLVEAARQVAPLAAAVAPARRPPWAAQRRDGLPPGPHWESLVASLALAWVGSTGFDTDVLWGDEAAPGLQADRLWWLKGVQQDMLAQALVARWGARAVTVGLDECVGPSRALVRGFHACADADDEAGRAAACVIAHINAGRQPLALVAHDRQLTRRISALLHDAGLALRDDTGWKLSTTHAASQLLGLLRAAEPRARMDEVLDLLKQAPAWPADDVQRIEHHAREQGVSSWSAAVRHPSLMPLLPPDLAALLTGLQSPRPLERWLGDLRGALEQAGLWAGLTADPAGQQLVRALRLDPAAAEELRRVGDALADAGRAQARIGLRVFTAWVRDVLEGSSFLPDGDRSAPVTVLPMAQLLGRPFAAVVMPGCDEASLDPCPDPGGQWTAAQREWLGLPGRTELAEAAERAWRAAVQTPWVDLLWRTQEQGEPLSVNPWVQAMAAGAALAEDPRAEQSVDAAPDGRPAPAAPALVPATLSASAYQDLRDCPYRFFALRMLRLSDAAELEAEPDQRDLGNWLHAVLRAFHEERGDQRPGREADTRRLDAIGALVAGTMGLQASDHEAGFLPFQAVWPALRDGYLDWLQGYELTNGRPGPRFEHAEAELASQAGRWRLWGKLDRIDRQATPEGALPLVLDYKTESRERTRQRVREPLEDTQLAFYGALLPDDNLRAGYLSITDGRSASAREGATHLFEQADVLPARDQLRTALADDMDRLAAGATLPALGEGRVCEHCAARGLCRRDMWSQA